MTHCTSFHLKPLSISEQLNDTIRLVFYVALIGAFVVAALVAGEKVGLAILWGGIPGIVLHWLATYKCAMAVPRHYTERDLTGVAEGLGYRSLIGDPSHLRLTLPRLLFFNHQDLVLKRSGLTTTVIGPRQTLKTIKRLLAETK